MPSAALHTLLDFVRVGKRLLDADNFEGYERFLVDARRAVLDAIATLDRYLTDRDDARSSDAALYDADFGVLSNLHLSDGGYSRLSINPMEGWIGFDRGLAGRKALLRWDAIAGEKSYLR